MGRFVVTAMMLILAVPATAHELWLQPTTYQPAEGEGVKITARVGDAADVKPWTFGWDKVTALRSHAPGGGIADHQAAVNFTKAGAPLDATIALQGPGTHMLVIETYMQPHLMKAAAFNAYLAEDGLTRAIEQRRRLGTTGTPGREVYSRRTKLLLQVGDRPTDEILRPIGQTLELVPEVNPYALAGAGQFPVRVVFEGKPLAGALVALTALNSGSKPLQRVVSDGAGRAVFDVPRRGEWMVSVVWTRPTETATAADFATIFASMSFGNLAAGGGGR